MLRSFTDKNGLEWKIVIGLYTARRVKELSDGRIDFVDTSRAQSARNALIEMAEDVEMTAQVLWWLCESQAGERGLSEIEFAESFDLDILDAAQCAVAEAVIDFFPSRHRAALRKATEIARQAYETEMVEVDQLSTELIESPEFERMIRQAVTAGVTSGSSQDLHSVDPLISSVSHPS